MNNSDMPAMPCDALTPDDILLASGGADIPAVIEYHGLTKREHFAGLAMQAMLARVGIIGDTSYQSVAAQSLYMADALLKELDK